MKENLDSAFEELEKFISYQCIKISLESSKKIIKTNPYSVKTINRIARLSENLPLLRHSYFKHKHRPNKANRQTAFLTFDLSKIAENMASYPNLALETIKTFLTQNGLEILPDTPSIIKIQTKPYPVDRLNPILDLIKQNPTFLTPPHFDDHYIFAEVNQSETNASVTFYLLKMTKNMTP